MAHQKYRKISLIGSKLSARLSLTKCALRFSIDGDWINHASSAWPLLAGTGHNVADRTGPFSGKSIYIIELLRSRSFLQLDPLDAERGLSIFTLEVKEIPNSACLYLVCRSAIYTSILFTHRRMKA
jgi:hypothetical protein